MFRVEHTWILWFLLLIPLMVVAFYLVKRWRKNARARFAEAGLFEQLMPTYSHGKYRLKFTFFIIGYAFLIMGVANPQVGSKLEEVKREGIDLIIALDVSNSMKAQDIQPNRLERAKMAMQQLVGRLKSDRLGIIVFAGEAYTQLPITTDYAAAKLFLNTIDTDIVPTQGTDLAAAIELGTESFDMESSSGKAIIIVTDGENHEPNAIEAAESAVEKGIQIYTIGMGTPTGSPIPVYKNGKQNGFRQDREGNTVISSLNENMLRELSDVGNGMYIRANDANVGFQDILADLSSMETQEFESSVYTDYEDRFQFFLGVAFIFLLLSLLMSEKKSKWSQKIKLFES